MQLQRPCSLTDPLRERPFVLERNVHRVKAEDLEVSEGMLEHFHHLPGRGIDSNVPDLFTLLDGECAGDDVQA